MKNFFYRLDRTVLSNSGSSNDRESNRPDRRKFMEAVFERLQKSCGRRVLYIEKKTTQRDYLPAGSVIKFQVSDNGQKSIAFNLNNYSTNSTKKMYAQLGIIDPDGLNPVKFADWLKRKWTPVFDESI